MSLLRFFFALRYGLSVLLTTGALCGLTYAFWVGGETKMAGPPHF